MSRASQAHFRPRRRRRQFIGGLFAFLCFLATLTGVIVLTVLLGSILWKALAPLPNPPWYQIGDQARELFGYLSRISDQFGSRNPARAGYKAGIAGSLWLLGLVALLSIPIGVAAGVYLEEYARPGRLRWLIGTNLANLAGIPSIVYGLFALVTVGPILRDWLAMPLGLGNSSSSVMTAGLVMGIMLIPYVSSLSDDIINAVPQAMRDGSFGLGATQSETVKRVVLPAALPGIVGAVLLAASRAIGETMIVVMGAGAAAKLSLNPFEAMTTVTVKIVSQLTGDTEFASPETLVAFALGLTLFCFTLGLNVFALVIVRKYREQYE